MSGAKFRPLNHQRISTAEMADRAESFNARMQERRSVRHFSDDPIPLDVVRRCIEAASSAPSGAHKQPWTFVLVTSPEIKSRIREAAEEEERAFYGGRAPDRWLRDLDAMGTTADKPFIEDAPALIALFAQRHGPTPEERHYYVSESVGIAAGFLIAALHHAGLCTLTHTPSPMRFLSRILGRPDNERPYLLLPVGYPATDAEVPNLVRKPLPQVLFEIE
ncbi:MAG: nitroreductase family protein [Myxococcota bacterium]